MKKFLLFTLICLLAFSLIACKSFSEMAEEKIREELNKESGGDDLSYESDEDELINESDEDELNNEDDEVDYDDGTVIYEGESGEEVNIGGNKWPTDLVAEHIPKLNAGEVTAAYNSANACLLTVDNVEKDLFEDYLNEIKDKGYTENPLDISEGESIHYYAENGEYGIQLTYDNETKEVGVNFMRLEF